MLFLITSMNKKTNLFSKLSELLSEIYIKWEHNIDSTESGFTKWTKLVTILIQSHNVWIDIHIHTYVTIPIDSYRQKLFKSNECYSYVHLQFLEPKLLLFFKINFRHKHFLPLFLLIFQLPQFSQTEVTKCHLWITSSSEGVPPFLPAGPTSWTRHCLSCPPSSLRQVQWGSVPASWSPPCSCSKELHYLWTHDLLVVCHSYLKKLHPHWWSLSSHSFLPPHCNF